jgi:hypothetical protein
VIASWREFAASGALLSYGQNRVFEAMRLAGYVQKVLNGTSFAHDLIGPLDTLRSCKLDRRLLFNREGLPCLQT